jgi:mono/diheme cytochrome c family protein
VAQHGNTAVPVRVLLHGKEGQTGLMPALGAAMTDAQVAQVLTYVRREWGQDGSPIAPAAVARVRAATKARKTPWTDAELAKVR